MKRFLFIILCLFTGYVANGRGTFAVAVPQAETVFLCDVKVPAHADAIFQSASYHFNHKSS